MNVDNWMSWEGGVDLVAATSDGLPIPNVILHVARTVHTPVGSAPSGMVLWQPDPAGAPEVMGFVSTNAEVAAYFGPHIFAGTPFEAAPALEAGITVTTDPRGSVASRIEVAGKVFDVELSGLGSSGMVRREPSDSTPFHQTVVEAVAGEVSLRVEDEPVDIVVPPVGISGGPAAVWAATGIYAR